MRMRYDLQIYSSQRIGEWTHNSGSVTGLSDSIKNDKLMKYV